MWARTLLLSGCLVVLAGHAVAAPTVPLFRAQLLDPFVGREDTYNASIYDLNNHGEVVGTLFTSHPEALPFVWSNGRLTVLRGTATPINPPPTGDSVDAFARGINDGGTVVGGHMYVGGYTKAIQWASRTAPRVRLPHAQDFGIATAVNNKGSIVGELTDRMIYNETAVMWRGTERRTLWRSADGDPHGRLGADASAEVNDVNELDQAVGSIAVPHAESPDAGRWSARHQAMFWDGNEAVQLLSPHADWQDTRASALNDSGVIVGMAGRSGPDVPFPPAGTRAVSWIDGVMHFLDGSEAVTTSHATDVNAEGWIVGGLHDDAILWIDGVALRLDSLIEDGSTLGFSHWDLTDASHVNDRGQIVVVGALDGQSQYALLTPVPEPSTMALALGGLAVLTWRARKAAAVRSQA